MQNWQLQLDLDIERLKNKILIEQLDYLMEFYKEKTGYDVLLTESLTDSTVLNTLQKLKNEFR